MAKTQRESTNALKSIKASQPKTVSTKTSKGGYTETTTKNKDGSTTVTANKPQYGTSGTVNNSDGSKTVYSGGGYQTIGADGRQTGAGLYGTENWGSNGGNYADLPGYKSGGGSSSSKSQPANSFMDSYTARLDSISRMLADQQNAFNQRQSQFQMDMDNQRKQYEAQILEMNNKLKYKMAEQDNNFNSVASPTRNGVQLFNPGGGANDIQINANGASNAVDGANGSYNNVLNRYLNNIWTGGF